MWATDPQSPSSSAPPTPSHSAVHLPPSTGGAGLPAVSTTIPPLPLASHNVTSPSSATPQHAQPHDPAPPITSSQPSFAPTFATTVPASSLPGARLSGRLVGVVSLTDILNVYARASGLKPADPSVFRNRRRRSSSASLGVRRSGDIGRELRSSMGR